VNAPLRRRRRQARERIEVAQTLCAIVRCGSLAVAIPADIVTFIALAQDTTVAPHPRGLHVRAGDLGAPGWLLPELLGIEGITTSWLFLRSTPRIGVAAIGCGECITVQKLPDPDPLPRGVLRAEGGAIIGAFRVDDAIVQRGCGIVGVWIDPERLIAAEVTAREASP
jgi:hypothetical protein